MNKILIVATASLALTGGFAFAQSPSDHEFANAALSDLHKLAAASMRSQQAAKDSDEVGCRESYEAIQQYGHDALTNMHSMSFEPIDAVSDVSTLLRLSHSEPDGCGNEIVTGADLLPTTAGQAIMALRWDYAIGDRSWYMIDVSERVQPANPLRYAQMLKDQNYSWVDVRPKDMDVMIEADWKTEMASSEVNDASIENSGNNLKAIEVDDRQNSSDNNTTVYFYKTNEEALQAIKRLVDYDPRESGVQLDAAWKRKLTSLPYAIANQDVGFKLSYSCKPTGRKDAKGIDICEENGSYDWSDRGHEGYHWFRTIAECDDMQTALNAKPPEGITIGEHDSFSSYCMPASKVKGRVAKGYTMVFSLSAPYSDF